MNSNGSSGYFVGPPVEAMELAAAQGVQKPGPPQVPGGGERYRAPGTTDGYFVGPPVVKVNPEPPVAPPPPTPAGSARKNKPSFLAKCVPCLFGGGASSKE